MKLFKVLLIVATFFVSHLSYSQKASQTTTQEKKTEVGKINAKVDKTNSDIKETNDNVKSTLSNTKETVGDIKSTFKSIFGSKEKKAKSAVFLKISDIDFDNEHLDALFEEIKKVKGAKKANRNFKDGDIYVEVAYKKGASELWGAVPKNIRSFFKLVQMDDTTIYLTLKD